MRLRPYRSALLAAIGIGSSLGAAQAGNLSELMTQVPPPPNTVAGALSWMQDGKIVAPEYTRIKQAIEAERASIEALNGGPLQQEGPEAPASSNGEAPEVQAALSAYGQYLAANSGKENPDMVLGKRARWLHSAMSGRLGAVLGQMQPCDVPCTDAAANAQNEPLLPNREQLARQDITQWNSLFADWKDKRSRIVQRNEAQIEATGDGAKAVSPQAKSGIARFRAAMLHEVELALSITELALKRAFAIETANVDAVSGATYSPRKPTPAATPS